MSSSLLSENLATWRHAEILATGDQRGYMQQAWNLSGPRVNTISVSPAVPVAVLAPVVAVAVVNDLQVFHKITRSASLGNP